MFAKVKPLAALLPLLAFGCQGVPRSEQQPISSRETRQLLAKVYSPEQLGITLVEKGGIKTARWKELVISPSSVRVPMTPPDGPESAQPSVLARINGGTAIPMVLDTGSPLTLVHHRVARANQLRMADPAQVSLDFRGPGGGEQTYFGMIHQMEIGALEFQGVFAAVRTQTFQKQAAGRVTHRWEGNLIGLASLIRLSYLTIDYPAQTVTLSGHEPFPEPSTETATRIPFRLQGMQMLVDLEIGDGYSVTVLFDTGNDSSLMLSRDLLNQVGLTAAPDPARARETYVGIGGEVVLETAILPKVGLGGRSFEQVPVAISPKDFPPSIGSGFLRQHRVTIDFKRKAIWLETPPIKAALTAG